MPNKNTYLATNCHCLPGAMVEFCPVHSDGADPIYDASSGGDLREVLKESLMQDVPALLVFTSR